MIGYVVGKKVNMFNSKRSQSILEYVILVSIAVAAVAAMGTYIKRAVQAKFKVIEEQVNNPEEIHDD